MSKTFRFALILLVLIVIFTVFGIHRHRSSRSAPEAPTPPSSSSAVPIPPPNAPADKTTMHEPAVPSSIPRHDSLRVNGLVTDGASGRPIASAEITAQRETPSEAPPDPRASALSDADGAYEIRIGPEAVTITCAAAGYATAIEVLPTSPNPSLKIDFKLGPGCGAAGIVRGQDTGKGIPDIEVEILSAPKGSQAPNALQEGSLRARRAVTDSSGGYSVDGLPPGTYLVWPHARSAGYLSSPKTALQVDLSAGDFPKNIDFTLERGASVSGWVHDASANPLEGAQIAAIAFEALMQGMEYSETGNVAELQAVSDAQGRFLLVGLTPNITYRLRATRQGYAPTASDPFLAPPPPADPPPLELVMLRGSRVTGQAFLPDGSPASRRSIQLFPEFGSAAEGVYALPQDTVIGDDGSFSFEGVAAGKYFVPNARPMTEAKNENPLGISRVPVVVDGLHDPEPLAIRLDNVDMGAGPRDLSGVVVDEKDQPVSGARVIACATDNPADRAEAVTGDSGSFKLSGLRGKLFNVAAIASAGNALETGIGAGLQITLCLVPATRVSGTVVDAMGNPAADCSIRAAYLSNPESSDDAASILDAFGLAGTAQATDAKGAFTLSLPIGGGYRIFAQHPRLGSGSTAPLAVIPGKDLQHILVSLAPNIPLNGTVVTTRGEPVAEATITLLSSDESADTVEDAISQTRSGPNGRFTFEEVKPGRYALRAEASPLATAYLYDIEAGRTIPPRDLTIVMGAGGTLRGRYTVNGLPVEGVTVQAMGQAESRAATTDSTGSFSITALSPGEYGVTAIPQPRFDTPEATRRFTIPPPVRVEIVEGQTTEIALGPDEGVEISGKILGNLPQTPILVCLLQRAGGENGASSSAGQRLTGALVQQDGTYRLEGVRPGMYTLEVQTIEIDPARITESLHEINVLAQKELSVGHAPVTQDFVLP